MKPSKDIFDAFVLAWSKKLITEDPKSPKPRKKEPKIMADPAVAELDIIEILEILRACNDPAKLFDHFDYYSKRYEKKLMSTAHYEEIRDLVAARLKELEAIKKAMVS